MSGLHQDLAFLHTPPAHQGAEPEEKKIAQESHSVMTALSYFTRGDLPWLYNHCSQKG